MQAADLMLADAPANGRVDQSIFFLISEAPKARDWVNAYVARSPQSRLPVVFLATELRNAKNDRWLTRNIIRSQLFSRDLFNTQLPVESDLFFFGRENLVADQLDAIHQSQNRGLFGLRKTGKTSVLYKLRRLVEREERAALLYYDCKLPSLRNLNWQEFLDRIVREIRETLEIPETLPGAQLKHASDRLIQVLDLAPAGKVIALVFDEIEYISPLAVLDPHWHSDFIPFWQTLWAAQSQFRRVSITVAGVNPFVAEIDVIGGVQNPMFGIIPPYYLQGLTVKEMESMVTTLGRRMGLFFSPPALKYLMDRYGGHPLLTRMACSFTNSTLERVKRVRPTTVEVSDLVEDQEARDAELVFYCRHVVSELRQFYPDEYEVLEMLANKQERDVMDLMPSSEMTGHLKGYGLLKEDTAGKPIFAIPVLGRYIGAESARREGRQLLRRIIPEEERLQWITRRTECVIREMRELCKLISSKGAVKLYGRSGFPEVDRVSALTPVSSEPEFESFINVCNRSFVESIEHVGQSAKLKNYFWVDVKVAFPELWDALHRIKVYRNNQLHLELMPTVESDLRTFLQRDLDGKRISQVPDVWFVLQQCVLDGVSWVYSVS